MPAAGAVFRRVSPAGTPRHYRLVPRVRPRHRSGARADDRKVSEALNRAQTLQRSGKNANSVQKGCTVDTVLLGGGETAKVAFVADNPGDWMPHCHILGHADSGMMTVFRVT